MTGCTAAHSRMRKRRVWRREGKEGGGGQHMAENYLFHWTGEAKFLVLTLVQPARKNINFKD